MAPAGLGTEGDALAAELRASLGETLLVGARRATDRPGGMIDVLDLNDLLAQVADALRSRTEPELPSRPPLSFAGYTLDFDGCTLVNAAGAEIALTPREFALLREVHRPSGPGSAVAGLVLPGAASGVLWYQYREPTGDGIPTVAVLAFDNLSGNSAEDYFGQGIADEIGTILATFPGVRVASSRWGLRPGATVGVREAAHTLDARYILAGAVLKAGDKVRVTAELSDGTTGRKVWANRYDDQGPDVIALQENIANKIYDSIAGVQGQIRTEEERIAWRKSAPSLSEYDYYLRGHQYFLRFTAEDNAHAREIWQEGLTRFANSALLRTKLAWTYQEDVGSGQSVDPAADIERAWSLARAVTTATDASAFAVWKNHWLMAFLYQWHDGDFDRSVVEAEIAVRMVPYDAFSRASLASYLANAGKLDEAIDWALWAVRRDPRGPAFFSGNLAWAYYLAGRHDDAWSSLRDKATLAPLRAAPVLIHLGRGSDAHSLIVEWLKTHPHDSIATQSRRPLKEPFKQTWLDDLRKAGLPEN